MGVAWSLTKSKDEKCFVSGFDELQWYHMVGIVAGIVVCVCAVFAIATFLGNMTPILLYVVRIPQPSFPYLACLPPCLMHKLVSSLNPYQSAHLPCPLLLPVG